MLLRVLSAAVLTVSFLLVAAAPGAAHDAGRVAQWQTFFGQVLPYVADDFKGIRGSAETGDVDDSVYSVTASLDDTLVKSCNINFNIFWRLDCDEVPAYTGSDATSLAADISAALPSGFARNHKVTSAMQWDRGATVVLLMYTFDTDSWGLSVGNNP